MQVEIIAPYTSQYPDPIHFTAGEMLQVGREDPEFPDWFWCRTQTGKEGWVHRSFLNGSAGEAVADYSAHELTVSGGERGLLLQRLDGWACLRLDGGEQGWIPESNLRILSA
jgi:SH3-like domain-containing protein